MFVFGIDESIPVPLFRACSIPSKVNVVDDAGNVVDTYSNAAKNIEGPVKTFVSTEAVSISGSRAIDYGQAMRPQYEVFMGMCHLDNASTRLL